MAVYTLTDGTDVFPVGEDTSGGDEIYGLGGDDDLRGYEGDDTIDGGVGNDLLDGGAGRDRLLGGDGDDLLQGGTGDDFIDGGAGRDTMILYGSPEQYELSLLADGSVRILNLNPEYEDAGTTQLDGSADVVTNVELLRFYDGTVFDLAAWIQANSVPAGFNVVRGTEAGNTLVGTANSDAIYGLAGDDNLIGGDGDDLLIGGQGGDAFDGGAGVDTVSYRSASSAVRIVPSSSFEGTANDAAGDTFVNVERIELTALDDTVYWQSDSAITVVGHEGEDLLVGGGGDDLLAGGDDDDNLNGADGDDVLEGGSGADLLEGGGGDDVLAGGGGADVLHGGDGYDTATFADHDAGVVIGYAGGEDSDYLSIEAFQLTAFDDQIRLPASRGENGISPAAISDVFAGAGDDFVDGGAVAGSLFGEAGNDTLIAGFYGSLLDGGDGDDTLVSSFGGDVIEGGNGQDIVLFGRPLGEYLFERDGDAILVAHVESGWVDRLTGVETLSFPDPVSGARVVIEAASIQPAATQNFQIGDANSNVLQGTVAKDVILGQEGSDQLLGGGDNDVISGGQDADVLSGGAGNDQVYGGAGNDRLDGGADADQLYGGTGNDSYIVSDTADRVYENASEGTDTVSASVTFALGASIENLTLTGTAAINGTGNALNNVIHGNSAANILNGGAGADRLAGGGGDDTYIIDNVGDVIVETASAGTDIARARVSYTLAANVENLTLTGTAAINGTGNALDNFLRGNNAANVLNGGAGADQLSGNGGNDTLKGGDGNDWLQGGAGRDAIYGGTGVDVYTFDDGQFAGMSSSTCDEIFDFNHAEGDRINLQRVDANSQVAGDQPFAFIGTDTFHHVAGELRYERLDGNTYVYGDTNGDGAADFMIKVDGLHTFVSGDFFF